VPKCYQVDAGIEGIALSYLLSAGIKDNYQKNLFLAFLGE
jgi:hypothetical protein